MRRAVLLALLGVAVLSSTLTWLLWPPDESPYYELVARLRAAGEPVDFETLKEPDVPPEQNGAAELVAACKWLDENVPKERWDTVPGPWSTNLDLDWQDHPTPEQTEALASFADELAPFFDRVRTATSKPRIQFRQPRDAFGFPDGSIPVLQRVQRALFPATSGARSESARLDGIVSMAELAVHVDCESAIDQMVAMSILGSALQPLRREVESSRIDPAAARAALDPLLRERWTLRMPKIVRAERAWFIQAYRTVLDGTYPFPRRKWYVRLWSRIQDGTPNLDEMAPGMGRLVVEHSDSAARALAVAPEPLRSYRDRLGAVASPPTPGGAQTLYVRLCDHLVKAEAQQALARVALAVAEVRARTGEFPASLDAMAKSFSDGIPTDPYTGGSFVYEKTDDGVRISSACGSDAAMLREWLLAWELK